MTLERLKQLRAMVYADYECLSEFGDDVQYEKDLLELIDAEIKRNKSGKWISIKDRLPDDNTDVLIFTKFDDETRHDTPYVRQAKYKEKCWYDVDVNTASGITHWMPLPELPKEVE